MINLNECKAVKYIDGIEYYKIYFRYNKIYTNTHLLMRNLAIIGMLGIVLKALGLDKNG